MSSGRPPVSESMRSISVRTALVGASLASIAAAAYVVAGLVGRLAGQPMAPWVIGRASGFVSYTLMLVLVFTGLGLSHSAAARLRWPGPSIRIGLHVTLAVFTLAFTVLHVVVLATDSY